MSCSPTASSGDTSPLSSVGSTSSSSSTLSSAELDARLLKLYFENEVELGAVTPFSRFLCRALVDVSSLGLNFFPDLLTPRKWLTPLRDALSQFDAKGYVPTASLDLTFFDEKYTLKLASLFVDLLPDFFRFFTQPIGFSWETLSLHKIVRDNLERNPYLNAHKFAISLAPALPWLIDLKMTPFEIEEYVQVFQLLLNPNDNFLIALPGYYFFLLPMCRKERMLTAEEKSSLKMSFNANCSHSSPKKLNEVIHLLESMGDMIYAHHYQKSVPPLYQAEILEVRNDIHLQSHKAVITALDLLGCPRSAHFYKLWWYKKNTSFLSNSSVHHRAIAWVVVEILTGEGSWNLEMKEVLAIVRQECQTRFPALFFDTAFAERCIFHYIYQEKKLPTQKILVGEGEADI